MTTQNTQIAKEIIIEAVVIRKDGRIENLGVISYWSKNPLKMAWWRLTQLFKRIFKNWEFTK